MRIRELKPDELETVYPFIRLLNQGMTRAKFSALLGEMRGRGYRCLAAFEGSKMLGIAGFWITAQFFSGKQVEIDNLVVLPQARGKRLGAKLARAVERLAVAEGCSMAFLKTYTYNYASHRFYFREGYHILGYGFVKELP